MPKPKGSRGKPAPGQLISTHPAASKAADGAFGAPASAAVGKPGATANTGGPTARPAATAAAREQLAASVPSKQQPGASCNSTTPGLSEPLKAVGSIRVGSPRTAGNSSKSAAASPRAAYSPRTDTNQSKSAAASPRTAGQTGQTSQTVQTTFRPPWSSSSKPSSSSNKHKPAHGSSSGSSPTTAAAAASTSRVASPTKKGSPSRHKPAATVSCKSPAGTKSQAPSPLEAAVCAVGAGSKVATKMDAAVSGKPLSVFIECAEAPGELREGTLQ
jgi:hypothetical protein